MKRTHDVPMDEFQRSIWQGHGVDLDEFDSLVSDKCHASDNAAKGTEAFRGGNGYAYYDAALIAKIWPFQLTEHWKRYMETSAEMLTVVSGDLKEAINLYETMVKQFRSAVKNDISSAKSAAIAVEENVRRMGIVYQDTAAMLTSATFCVALENAERMAVALKAISELKTHSITFAVLDKKADAK